MAAKFGAYMKLKVRSKATPKRRARMAAEVGAKTGMEVESGIVPKSGAEFVVGIRAAMTEALIFGIIRTKCLVAKKLVFAS